eukprot:363247-Chlamydomonas_euryale.AAC.5
MWSCLYLVELGHDPSLGSRRVYAPSADGQLLHAHRRSLAVWGPYPRHARRRSVVGPPPTTLHAIGVSCLLLCPHCVNRCFHAHRLFRPAKLRRFSAARNMMTVWGPRRAYDADQPLKNPATPSARQTDAAHASGPE